MTQERKNEGPAISLGSVVRPSPCGEGGINTARTYGLLIRCIRPACTGETRVTGPLPGVAQPSPSIPSSAETQRRCWGGRPVVGIRKGTKRGRAAPSLKARLSVLALSFSGEGPVCGASAQFVERLLCLPLLKDNQLKNHPRAAEAGWGGVSGPLGAGVARPWTRGGCRSRGPWGRPSPGA